ncbi:hypothetical protein BDY21DRAFT_383422 [Lineolata rhizophorae]|uniref:AHC1-like C2H2 zinc-finger domain-containing protein n=1 Tax=Lineolata rhizophorae TaxID=578093 RepID=A0A6A6PBL7_9PEZI|nr:hypothetical protein BDY21DRAFT_383422 [Lineolata rhizophorae]
MQSMFRFPWASEPGGDKHLMDKFAQPQQSPVVDIPLLNKLKRKATGSPEPVSPQAGFVAKKWKCGSEAQAPNAPTRRSVKADVDVLSPRPSRKSNAPEDVAQGVAAKSPENSSPVFPSTVASSPMQDTVVSEVYTPLQEAIEAHFNYEILLKHQELRLIEQELAKCQISLEQLRRCQLIPFPGSESASENVSGGVGPALEPPSGQHRPQHPAPWGVTDGPYTRHYAKWLIPDPAFDSVPPYDLGAAHGLTQSTSGRSTRASYLDQAGVAGKSRSSRNSSNAKLHALTSDVAPPKDKSGGPLYLRRSTDGQLVELFCDACQRGDFSSVQGFLNHCRIKHNKEYKSHDAAAIACGRPVDEETSASAAPGPQSVAPTSAPVMTPATEHPPALPSLAGGASMVHPLIRSNNTQQTNKLPPRPLKGANTLAPKRQKSPDPVADATSNRFVASAKVPHLSKLISKHGFDGCFDDFVGQASAKIDIGALEGPSDDEGDSALTTPARETPTVKSQQQLSRLPARAPAPLNSSKIPRAKMTGGAQPQRQQQPGSLNVGSKHVGLESPTVELSPNTVESNPGLVSDREGDDDDDDEARSVAPANLGAEADIGVDVEVEDSSDVERPSRVKGLRGFGPGSSRKGGAK